MNLTMGCFMTQQGNLPRACIRAVTVKVITDPAMVVKGHVNLRHATCMQEAFLVPGKLPQSLDHPDCQHMAFTSIATKLDEQLRLMPTTLTQDEVLLQQIEDVHSAAGYSPERHTALLFRLQLKRTLVRTLASVRARIGSLHQSIERTRVDDRTENNGDELETGALINWPVAELTW